MCLVKATQKVEALAYNIYWYLLSVLLFLPLLCCTYGPVYVQGIRRVTLFPEGGIRALTIDNTTVRRFKFPFFVAGGGLVVAFAEAHYSMVGNTDIDIVAKYIETEGKDWVADATNENEDNWMIQRVMQKKKEEYYSVLRNPTAVVKDNKIYLLVVKNWGSKFNFYQMASNNWDFKLVVGEIKNKTQGTGKTIIWQEPKLTLSNLTQQFKNNLLTVPFDDFNSSAFLTKDGKIVFVVKAKTEEGKIVSTIIYSKGPDFTTEWELSYVGTAEDCYSPSVFEWEGKLTMVPTDCPGGSHRVKHSIDMGRTWADASGSFSFLWNDLKDKGNFITTTIDYKTVLLFTFCYSYIDWGTLHLIYLGFTDGIRVHIVRPIVAGFGNATPIRFLYTKGELLFLHQILNTTGSSSNLLSSLKRELREIKYVLKLWAKNDRDLSKPCNETVPKGATSDTFCVTPVPTSGLIGFLSNKGNNTRWMDNYLYVNAIVRGGTKVDNGFKFIGATSGAKWSVGEQYPYKRYKFTKHGLTVVATVTIHEVPTGDNSPLLTVGGVKDDERLGLGYGREKQWKVLLKSDGSPGGVSIKNIAWETSKEYRVALMLQNKRFFAFVNGDLVGEGFRISSSGEGLFDIRHLFIGPYEVDDRTGSAVNAVTVTNVFLYNRPLNDTELKTLSERLENMPRKGVALFVPWTTKVPESMGSVRPVKDVKSFRSVFFASANGLLVAFAEAHYAEGDIANIDIVARHVTTKGSFWARNVNTGGENKWATQLVTQNKEAGYVFQLRQPMAVGKGNTIYLLAVRNRMVFLFGRWYSIGWGFVLVVGEICLTNREQGSKTIEWQTPLTLSKLTNNFKSKWRNLIPSTSSAFLTKDRRIVFVLEAENMDGGVSAIIYSKDTRDETKLEVSYVENSVGCLSPNIFPWEGKLIMSVFCREGIYKLKESTDMGKTWTDVVGPISRLWDNMKDKKGFTTVTIKRKKVLLFTQRRNADFFAQSHNEIRLWFTDGNRVHDIGPIGNNLYSVTSSGFLYTKGELFFLHHQDRHPHLGNAILPSLKNKTRRIKHLLRILAEKDEYLSKPCNETVPKGATSDTFCLTPVPTDGLVGFLSGKGSATYWRDEYFYINAVVKRGRRVCNGFTFRGAGSGAEWPVFQEYPNERYNFSRYGLTVVATVTIHEVPQSEAPVLTVGGVWGKERLGLWYSKEKQWEAVFKKRGTPAGGWETNKTYRVALMLNNDVISAYVDGMPVGDPVQLLGPWKNLPGDQHLFIGDYEGGNGIGGIFSHVTVSNVLLYNRPLNDTEFVMLGKRLKKCLECHTSAIPRSGR